MTWRLFSMMMEDLRLLTQYRPYFRISFCCSDWKSFLGIQFGSQQPVKDPHQKLTSKPHMGQTIMKKRISFKQLSASTSMCGMKYQQLAHCINCQLDQPKDPIITTSPSPSSSTSWVKHLQRPPPSWATSPFCGSRAHPRCSQASAAPCMKIFFK